MKAQFTALLAALTLVGCGGGSSTSPPDNIAALAQAAIKAIADKTPTPKVFDGAFVAVAGNSQGWLAGTSERDIATRIAQLVQSEPVKYADYYRALLSAEGLKITIFGASLGITGAASGLPLYAPDTIFLATLRSDGLHVVQIN